jgi:hypothetical protein
MNIIKYLLNILQFPQNIIGYIGYLFYQNNPQYKYNNITITYVKGVWGAITLGNHIFADDNYFQDIEIIKHEFGHILQSKKLLFLFIPMIGIPSLIWAGCFKNFRVKHNISYYWFYTEKWANKLGKAKLN